MKSHLPVSLLLLFAFCCSQSVLAQTASMAGTVKDSTAAVVPEVRVTVRNNRTNASRSALTDRSGSYRIASLGPGSYDVVIEKSGFKVVEYPRVELTVDQVQSLDVILTPSAITERCS